MNSEPAGPRAARVLADSAVYGLAAVVAKSLALITIPYLTRALGPDGYGLADLATSTAALLTVVVSFAGDIPAARHYGTTPDRQVGLRALSSYIWATVLVGTLVAVALIPAAPAIARTFWGVDDQGSLALLAVLLVPLSSTQTALSQTLRIRGKPKAFAAVALVDLIAQLALAVVLVTMGFGPSGVVVGFIFGSTLGLGASAYAARAALRIRPTRGTAVAIVHQGTAFLPRVAMFVLADWSIRAVLANSHGTLEVAELGLAIRGASIVSLAGAAFALAWGPIGLARARDLATARHFGRVLQVYGVMAIAIAVTVGLIGPEVIPFVAGPGYDGAALILPGLGLAYAIAGIEYVLVVTAGVSDRASRVAWAATAGAALQVGAALLLIPIFGVPIVGMVAVVGRAMSFAILWAAVRSSILLAKRRLLVSASVVAVTLAAVQLLVMQGSDSTVARWVAAAGMSFLLAMLTVRLSARPRIGKV